jgi:Flp pilus assembly protein TadG
MRRRKVRRWRGERGQSLLETAMVMLIIFMVVFWVFEVGWLMHTFCVMADAANEGVRHAMVHSGGDSGGTQTVVKTFAATSLHDTSAIAVSVTFPDGGAAPPKRVRVTVTYTYVPWLRFVMTTPPSMRTFAEGRMVVQ